MSETSEAKKFAADFAEALKDGPVVLSGTEGLKGFADLPSALAYLEAINIANGVEDEMGGILVIGPNSIAAVKELLKEDEDGYDD